MQIMHFPLATVAQFTDHLRALRKARGMTQADLGRLMGVSQSRIADIERDPGSVSVTQMHQILSALGGQMILHDSGGGWKFQPSTRARATKTDLVHYIGGSMLTSKAPASPTGGQIKANASTQLLDATAPAGKAPAKPKAGRHVVNVSSKLRGVLQPLGKAPAKPKTGQYLVNADSKVIRSTLGPSKKPGGSW
jgi:transcriptional regulator with XRE-family HTH domain